MSLFQKISKFTANIVATMVGGGYDAAKPSGTRRIGSGVLRSEDDELRAQERRVLLSTSQSVFRNFSVARWMVSRHLDYVSTFTFQAKTGNTELDRRLESLVKWWSRADNFEVTGRFTRKRYVRNAELQRVLNGDFFTLKIRNGKVQPIEGDRVRSDQIGMMPPGRNPAEFLHGVRANDQGRPLEYCVCRRGRSSDFGPLSSRFLFEKLIPSRNMIPLGYYDRFDQVRGISPLACALNPLSDVYEGSELAVAKMKHAQALAVAFFRNPDPAGDDLAEALEDPEDGDEEAVLAPTGEPTEPKYGKINWGKGPVQIDLDPGDRMEMVESKTPSTEFQAFIQVMIQVALKSLDIPYSFYSENFTNYSGQRQALLLYEEACKSKREDLQEFLDRLLFWRAMLWIQDGRLDCRPDDLRWEWIPSGVPWIDPLKETQANVQQLAAGLASRTGILREAGKDFMTVADELAFEQAYLASKGLPTNIEPANVQITEVAA